MIKTVIWGEFVGVRRMCEPFVVPSLGVCGRKEEKGREEERREDPKKGTDGGGRMREERETVLLMKRRDGGGDGDGWNREMYNE